MAQTLLMQPTLGALGADTPGFVRITFAVVIPPLGRCHVDAVLRREIIFLDVAICHSLIYKIKKPIVSTEPGQENKH